VPTQGVEFGPTFEFMDRDTATRTDPADTVLRPGFNAVWFPVPYTELNVLWRTYLAREDRAEDGSHEVIAFLHIFY